MHLDSGFGDIKLARYLFVAESLGQVFQDLQLTAGQLVEIGPLVIAVVAKRQGKNLGEFLAQYHFPCAGSADALYQQLWLSIFEQVAVGAGLQCGNDIAAIVETMADD